MNNNASIVLLAGIAATMLFSCKKSDNTPVSYAGISAVFTQQALQPKTVLIDAGNANSFYGNSGTRYVFAANSFQTAAGVPVTGQVTLQVSEYLQKGDMIFSKMLPISNNEPLLSGGELNVTATQGGQPLYLRPGMTFQANMPQSATAPAGLALFFGQKTDSNSAAGNVNWIPAAIDSTVGGVVIGADTIGIISDSLNECNADAFMSSPDFQNFNVTVNITGVAITSSTVIYGYTLYDTYKGVWPLGMIGSYSNGVFNEKHVPNIPVHIVVFTVINGQFYGGTLGSITPATGSNYTVTLNPMDAGVFKTAVNAL